MNIKKSKIKLIFIISVVILVLASSFIYAYFSSNFDELFNIKTGDVAMTVKAKADVTGWNFTENGSTYSNELTISNKTTDTNGIETVGATNITYDLTISGLTVTLRESLILKIDNKVYGSLAKFMDKDNLINVDLKEYLVPGESITHKIDLELSHEAYALFSGQTFDLRLGAVGKTFTDKNYIFVKTADDFMQAVKHVNAGKYIGKTIVLSNDIVLSATSDINFTKNINIDFNGKKLTLGKNLNFAPTDAGYTKLYSSYLSGTINFTSDTNKVDFNSSASYLTVDNVYCVVNDIVPSTSKITITAFNPTLLGAKLNVILKDKLRYGVSSEVIDLIGGYKIYGNNITFELGESEKQLLTLTEDKKLSKNATVVLDIPVASTLKVTVSLPNATSYVDFIPFDILTTDAESTAIFNKIKTDYLGHLAVGIIGDTGVTPPDLKRDLFLPQSVRDFDATIEWISSNTSLLEETGKFNPGTEDKEVKLTAVIKFNGKTFIQEYVFNVKSISPQEILDKICSENYLIFTAVGQKLPLIDETKYPDITYTLNPDVADIFTISPTKDSVTNKKTITLDKNTNIKKSFVEVKATVQGAKVTSKINIAISIDNTGDTVNEAHRYVQTFFSHINKNTYKDFDLPKNYKGGIVTMTYQFSLDGKTYSDKIGEYLSLKSKDENYFTVDIDPNKVPIKNTPIYLKVTYKYNNTDYPKDLNFVITGIIHNNENEVADFNLYIKLAKLVQSNNPDHYILYDDMVSHPIENFILQNAGIENIKGIELFNITNKIDLSNNKIVDISYLSKFYSLKELDLTNNLIQDISPLANLVNMETLVLKNNSIFDISTIEKMQNLKYLDINLNSSIDNISCILKMKNLAEIYAKDTTIKNKYAENENYIFTAYYNYKANNNNVAPSYDFGKRIDYNNVNLKLLNDLLNKIIPIYEFSNVIFLPPTIENGTTDYSITWTTSHTNIIKIEGTRAYITQPIADVKVTIIAEMTIGGKTMRKYFPVISRGDISTTPKIYDYTTNTEIDAKTAIPDEELRYFLFKQYDKDDNKKITKAEIELASNNLSANGLPLNMENLGIKNLTGLELFYALEKVNLSNNPFTDLTPIFKIMTQTLDGKNYKGITNLKLINSKCDFSKINSDPAYFPLNHLAEFNVFGSLNINTPEVETIFYNMLILMRSKNLYKDSIDKPWDPYKKIVEKAMSMVDSVIMLEPGGTSVSLKTQILINMYGAQHYVEVSYFQERDFMEETSLYTFSNNSIRLEYKNIPAKDTYTRLASSFTLKGKTDFTLKKSIIVLLKTNANLKVETANGTPPASPPSNLLAEVVADDYARQQILKVVFQDNKALAGDLITRDMLKNVTTLEFRNTNKSGLKGLEIFAGLNITDVTIKNHAEGINNLSALNSIASSLKNLTIISSSVDLTCLNLPKLETLTLTNCVKIVMENATKNVFDSLPILNTFTAHSNYILDFSPIAKMKNVKNLYIYNNPSSYDMKTNTAVEKCFANLSSQVGYDDIYDYKVENINSQWIPNINGSAQIKTVGGTYTFGGTTKNLNNGVIDVNYIIDNGTLALPTTYKDALNPITWSTAYTSVFNLTNLNAVAVTRQNMTSYATIKARLKIAEGVYKDFIYYFVIIGTGLTVNTDSVDLKTFMNTSNQLIDPYFTNYCINLLRAKDQTNTTGVYLKATAELITEIDFSNDGTNAKKYFIRNINGIEVFSNLTSLKLNYNAIEDISPLQSLTKLQVLYLNNNNIKTLWKGDDSIFVNMSNLQELQIAINPNIDDYNAISYSKKSNTTTIRPGLGKLAKIYSAPEIEGVQNRAGYYIDEKKTNVFNFYIPWWTARNSAQSTVYYTHWITVSNIPNMIKAINAINGHTETNYQYKGTNKDLFTSNLGGTAVNYEPIGYAYKDQITISGGKITKFTDEIFLTGRKIPIKMYIPVATNNGSFPMKIYKTVYLEVSNLIETNSPLIPQIELTVEEQTLYAITTAGNNYVNANLIIKDESLMNTIFANFDTDTNKKLAITERTNGAKTSINASYRGIKGISGIELFPGVSAWNFSGNNIELIPTLPFKTTSFSQKEIKFDFSNNYYLKDLSGLTYDKDTSNGVYTSLDLLTSGMDLSYCNVSQGQAQYLNKSPLKSINLSNTKINDYKFLLDNHTDTLESININSYGGNIFIENNDNKDKLSQILFNTTNGGNGLVISDINGISERIILPYLSKINNIKKDNISKELDSTFTAFGKTYSLIWTKPQGEDYTLTNVNGVYSIQVPTTHSGDIFNITCQVVNGTQNTFKQDLKVLLVTATGLSEYAKTEGTYQGVSGGAYENLSTKVPDIAVRYCLLKLFDKDLNGQLSWVELDMNDSNNTNYHNILTLGIDPQNGWKLDNLQYAINSLEGIDIVRNVKVLHIWQINTTDLSPIALMTSVEDLKIEKAQILLDDFKFLRSLTNLKYLSLNGTSFIGLELISDVTSLIDVKNGKGPITLSFRNAIAYSKANNNMQTLNIGTIINDTNAEEKLASIILSDIEMSQFLLKDSSNKIISNSVLSNQKAGTSLIFDDKINFQGADYLITYVPMTSNISFNQNTATLTAYSKFNTTCRFLARIEYNGSRYEKYFEFNIFE